MRILAAMLAGLLIQATTLAETDPDSGLVIDDNWLIVKAHCGACHSTRLVTQNRGSRQTWLDMIRWMQAGQGLWYFDPQTETNILDYLAKNYPTPDGYRRAPIPRSLMPENPYSNNQAEPES